MIRETGLPFQVSAVAVHNHDAQAVVQQRRRISYLVLDVDHVVADQDPAHAGRQQVAHPQPQRAPTACKALAYNPTEHPVQHME